MLTHPTRDGAVLAPTHEDEPVLCVVTHALPEHDGKALCPTCGAIVPVTDASVAVSGYAHPIRVP